MDIPLPFLFITVSACHVSLEGKVDGKHMRLAIHWSTEHNVPLTSLL